METYRFMATAYDKVELDLSLVKLIITSFLIKTDLVIKSI